MDIREGLLKTIRLHNKGTTDENDEELTVHILTFLNDNGVVRKVEAELPQYVGCTDTLDKLTKAIAEETQQDMLRAGYTLTAPLIEKVSPATDGPWWDRPGIPVADKAGVGFQYPPQPPEGPEVIIDKGYPKCLKT